MRPAFSVFHSHKQCANALGSVDLKDSVKIGSRCECDYGHAWVWKYGM